MTCSCLAHLVPALEKYGSFFNQRCQFFPGTKHHFEFQSRICFSCKHNLYIYKNPYNGLYCGIVAYDSRNQDKFLLLLFSDFVKLCLSVELSLRHLPWTGMTLFLRFLRGFPPPRCLLRHRWCSSWLVPWDSTDTRRTSTPSCLQVDWIDSKSEKCKYKD